MKINQTRIIKISAQVLLAVSLLTPLLAGAASSSTRINVENRMVQIKSRADQEINRRMEALNRLKTRVAELKKVSDSVKNSIGATVDSQITSLNALKSKIDADTDLATLRADVKSILDSYRIFALIIPQGHILAAADRINTIADSLKTIGAKLELRINQAKSAGKDTAALESLLADFNSKLADAKAKAAAASSAVSALTPDNGDQTKFKANQDALKAARADLKAGTDDLKTAREDAHKIVKGLKDLGLSKSASASSTAPGQQN